MTPEELAAPVTTQAMIDEARRISAFSDGHVGYLLGIMADRLSVGMTESTAHSAAAVLAARDARVLEEAHERVLALIQGPPRDEWDEAIAQACDAVEAQLKREEVTHG